jgi:hypothetical protein
LLGYANTKWAGSGNDQQNHEAIKQPNSLGMSLGMNKTKKRPKAHFYWVTGGATEIV